MRRNRLTQIRIRIGRLPSEAWERPGEMNDVLPGTAGDLKHHAPSGQNARKDIKNRALVALGRADKPLAVCSFFTALLKQEASFDGSPSVLRQRRRQSHARGKRQVIGYRMR